MKTSEMIAMLEKNPKLKFTLNGFSYKVGFNNRDEISGVNEKGDYTGSVTFTKNDDWQLAREPVPVAEAARAFENQYNLDPFIDDVTPGTIAAHRNIRQALAELDKEANA